MTQAEVITSDLVVAPTTRETSLITPTFTNLDEYLREHWQKATELFIASRKSENTRRAYRRHIAEFLAWANKMPWDIASADMQSYTEHCRKQGLTDETINAKVAAVSSYYSYLLTDYEIIRLDGTRGPLVSYNPASAKSLRTKVNPYGKSRWLSPEETRKLLKAIPQNSVQGLRDHAMFMFYLLTGRRNSETRLLRYGDFQDIGSRVFYVWSGKNKKNQKNEVPLFVWNMIQSYLKASGRLENIKDSDYIFTAISHNGGRLACVASRTDSDGNPLPYNPNKEPLSLAQIGVLLKKYARRAGLKVELIHPHTLRHTAAMLRKECGDDIEKISKMLGHSNIATTQIYVQALEGQKDTSSSAVQALLGY